MPGTMTMLYVSVMYTFSLHMRAYVLICVSVINFRGKGPEGEAECIPWPGIQGSGARPSGTQSKLWGVPGLTNHPEAPARPRAARHSAPGNGCLNIRNVMCVCLWAYVHCMRKRLYACKKWGFELHTHTHVFFYVPCALCLSVVNCGGGC